MDAAWTAINGSVDYANVIAFIAVAVPAAFTVRAILKSVGLAKSGLSRS